MTTVTLWLLIVASDNHRGAQTPQVLERFVAVADCQHVLANIPKVEYAVARCVQAKVAR